MEAMDTYTEDTKSWLDQRFREVDAEGVFLAHQPIYGFRRGHCGSCSPWFIIGIRFFRHCWRHGRSGFR